MSDLRIGDLCARVPVVQGGMGVGVSLSGLAGAVAAAGGVGVISTAQIERSARRSERHARRQTGVLSASTSWS